MMRLLLVGFCVALGVLFPVLGVRDHLLGTASETWPSTQGSIISEHRRTSKKTRYSIFYAYEVAGIRYENSRVNFQNDKASKRDIYQTYNKGDAVKVYYEPGNPQRSVLQTGSSYFSLMIRLFGGLFCLALAILFWNTLRRKS